MNNKLQPQNLELAWAAGFWDGEGCTGIKREKKNGKEYHYLKAQLNNTSEQTVRRFAAAVGIGHVYGPYQYKSRHRNKPYWRWQANNSEGHKAIQLLLPYMSDEKRQQYEDRKEAR